MFDPSRPPPPPGTVQTMGAPGSGGMVPPVSMMGDTGRRPPSGLAAMGQPQLPPGMTMQSMIQGYTDALRGWRDQRPTGEGADFRTALHGWRGAMPSMMGYAQQNGITFSHPGQPGAPGSAAPMPQSSPSMPPQPMASPMSQPMAQPANMVGSSYGVQGMSAPNNPYQLPTYSYGG